MADILPILTTVSNRFLSSWLYKLSLHIKQTQENKTKLSEFILFYYKLKNMILI